MLKPTSLRRNFVINEIFKLSSIRTLSKVSSGSSCDMSAEEVQHYVRNGVGTIVLNRPRVLNSLKLNMVQHIRRLLKAWAPGDSGVACVLIKGSGDKAFCAGGDVKSAVLAAMQKQYSGPDAFFDEEYAMDLEISRYPKPIIALMDGIVMGGGVGLSINCHFKVVTDRTVFAMPECGIGLFPDVGAGHFLSKLNGHLGLYLGLTGARLNGVSVREAGLATHYLPADHIHRVELTLQQLPGSQLSSLGSVATALDSLQASAGPVPTGTLPQVLPYINHYFHGKHLTEVFHKLQQYQSQHAAGNNNSEAELAFVNETVQGLNKGSPLSQLVFWELYHRAAHASLSACLDSDTHMVRLFVRDHGDFHEGVRATLIDKTQPAKWKYSSIDQTPPEVVDGFFKGGPFDKTTTHASANSPRRVSQELSKL